jgi:hypothetical protein
MTNLSLDTIQFFFMEVKVIYQFLPIEAETAKEKLELI